MFKTLNNIVIFKSLLLKLTTIFLLFLWFFNFGFINFVFADDDLATLKIKREELQKEISEIQKQLNQVRSDKKTLERQISILNLEIRELNIGIRQADLAIRETGVAIKEKEAVIEEIKNNIAKIKGDLSRALRNINEIDQVSTAEILIAYSNLSEFFNNLKSTKDIQRFIFLSLNDIKKLKLAEENNIQELQDDLTEQFRTKKLQEINLFGVKSKENEKKALASSKKGEEAALISRLEEVQSALFNIQRYFTEFVLKGTRVSTEDIISFVKEAGASTGIRAAYLLAALEVETKLGENIGKGDWQKDTKLEQRGAFLEVTKKLGLNPNDVPVSAKPSYGWGGAMGPAQFLPKTWQVYEDEIAKITGSNPPNPWNMRDAIYAMALFLVKRGANDLGREKAASRAYISGRPNCSSYICNSYANNIQKKAVAWQEYLESK